MNSTSAVAVRIQAVSPALSPGSWAAAAPDQNSRASSGEQTQLAAGEAWSLSSLNTSS